MAKELSFEERAMVDAQIQIVPLHGKLWKNRVLNCLNPPFAISGTPNFDRGEIPMESVFDLAYTKLHACVAIIQPYISTDWNSEYSEVYSRVFADIPRQAQRIHFFSKVVTYSDLYNIPKELKEAYLGYVVVRPLSAYRVGDTILKSPCSGTDSGMELVHCQEEYEVSLLGNHLTVRGMPFMQQDTTVAVCAETDLWMLARYLNKKGETGRYRPAEITKLANATITTGPGREGLFDLQMADAIRQMGLNPIVLYPEDAADAKSECTLDAEEAKTFIYTCIESGLPVITAIPGHVFTIIGHDYYGKVKFPSGISSISHAVNSFIVHDDSEGPYRTLKVGIGNGKKKNKKGRLLTLDGKVVDFYLVAFPPRVHIDWHDAWTHTIAWIEQANRQAKAISKTPPNEEIWQESETKNLVVRTYLRRSSEFKYDLSHLNSGTLRRKAIINKYLCMRMPKYIWVSELATPSDLKKSSLLERKIVGEIILDSTGNRHDPDETLLAFHLNGKMFTPQLPHGNPLIVDDSVPYDSWMRSAVC